MHTRLRIINAINAYLNCWVAKFMVSEIVVNNDRVLHLGLARGELAENVFLVGDPARAVRVSQRFDEIRYEVRNREYVTFTGTYGGVEMSVVGTGIGVDNVEIALVEAYAVHAFDFESSERHADAAPLKFIRIGTSAGVQDNVEPGTMAISTHGLGLDNGGMYYDHPAADDIVTSIEDHAYEILVNATPEGARFRKKNHSLCVARHTSSSYSTGQCRGGVECRSCCRDHRGDARILRCIGSLHRWIGEYGSGYQEQIVGVAGW